MTDRYSGFVVTLEENMREDDAQAVLAALRMVRGVIGVEPVISNVEQVIADKRARRELGEKLWAVLYPKD